MAAVVASGCASVAGGVGLRVMVFVVVVAPFLAFLAFLGAFGALLAFATGVFVVWSAAAFLACFASRPIGRNPTHAKTKKKR